MLVFHRLAERKTTWQVHQSSLMCSWYLHLFSINLHEMVTLGRRQTRSDVCVRDRRHTAEHRNVGSVLVLLQVWAKGGKGE